MVSKFFYDQIADTIDNQDLTFAITDTKLYVSVLTLSIQHNATLLQQLKSGFKRTINWNKYKSKAIMKARNKH